MHEHDHDVFFSRRWWHRFIDAWNNSTEYSVLAGLGIVHFIAETPGERMEIFVAWDNEGRASVLNGRDIVPTHRLSASTDTWHKFVEGRIKATKAVLEGHMVYDGQIRRMLPYSEHFNALSNVARQLSND